MLTLVPTPIGNLNDISKRSLDALFAASTILCEDTRITKKLLSLLKERHNQPDYDATFIAIHSHNEKEFVETLDKSFFDDEIVYASDAGMPGISDPGQFLVNYCLENDVPYDILPGASASILAFVASGFITTQFLFGGFLPHKGRDREEELNKMAFSGYTTVLYESPYRLLKCLEELSKLIPDREVFVAKELSKKFEYKHRDTALNLYNTVKEQTIKGEWIVVIKAGEQPRFLSLSVDEVLAMKLPTKDKSKLLASFTDKSAKQWYSKLQGD